MPLKHQQEDKYNRKQEESIMLQAIQNVNLMFFKYLYFLFIQTLWCKTIKKHFFLNHGKKGRVGY